MARTFKKVKLTFRIRLARWLLRGTGWTVYRQRKSRTPAVSA